MLVTGPGETISSMYRLTRCVSVCVLNISILRILAGASGIVLKDPWRSPERCQLLSRLDSRAHARAPPTETALGWSTSRSVFILPSAAAAAAAGGVVGVGVCEAECVSVCVCMCA